MSKLVDYAARALDAINGNKARVAVAAVTLASVAGVHLNSGGADVLVTLAAFLIWVLEEAARMAEKTKPAPAPKPLPVVPPAPPAPPAVA
jgi:hypothetical protein